MDETRIEKTAPAWLRELRFGPREVIWNLRGMADGWARWPLAMDFLDPASPNFALKAIETRLYLEAAPALRPDRPLRVLDAACGIGRFALQLAAAGCDVVAIDACLPSLEAAARHAAGPAWIATRPGGKLLLVWDDVDACAVPGEPFDLVLAIELLCYLPDPLATARRLAGMLAPGGLLVASVEAWPGALLADPSGVTAATLADVLANRVLGVRDERWVRPMEAHELASLLGAAGLDVVSLAGTHYLPDGPLQALLDPGALDDDGQADLVARLEGLLQGEPSLAGLARAWVAVARKSEGARCA